MNTTVESLLPRHIETVDPRKCPNEEFDLHSIPAHDLGQPEVVRGADIGSAKQVVLPGDVMISKIVPHIRRVAIVGPSRGPRQIASGEWIVMRSGEIEPRFLRHYLLSDMFHRQFMATVAGVGGSLMRARPAHAKKIEVPRPSLDEQRRIAAILDEADALRAKRRQVIDHLDSLTQAIFHDMFGTSASDRVKAGLLMPTMRNGVSPSTHGGVTADVLTLSAVTSGRFRPEAHKTGTFATTPGPDKRVQQADFLMCRGNGNRDLVGVGVVPDSDADLVFPDTVIAGRIDTRRVVPAYLQQAWRQQGVRDQIAASARTTNGTYKVNQQGLASVEVVLPPMGAQLEFARRDAHVVAQRELQVRTLNAEDALFASLQSRAFRGEL